MTTLLLLFAALSGPTVQNTPLRIGVAASDPKGLCLAMAGEAVAPGTAVTVITPTRPQRVTRARVLKAVKECPVMDAHITPGPYYSLQPDSPAENLSGVAIAIVGKPETQSVGGEVRLRLDDSMRDARVRSCTSMEGLHLTVWSGVPLESRRLWHAYWYLGYDTEPNCQQGDVG